MKRAIVTLTAVGLLAAVTGCTFPHGRCGTGLIHGSCQDAPEDCASCNGGCAQGDGANGACQLGDPDGGAAPCEACGGRGCGLCRHRGGAFAGAGAGAGAGLGAGAGYELGPPSASVTYPYYTVRGPRDFLARNPQTIGP